MHASSPIHDPNSPSSRATAPVGRGRPPLRTVEVTLAIAKVIRTYGLSDTRAALLAGVSSSSVSRWKQESEEFHDCLEMARAEFERARVEALLQAQRPDGSPDWRAQAWLLRNASREGGWGRAASPLPKAAVQNPETLPENPAAGEKPAPLVRSVAAQNRENLPKNTPASEASNPQAKQPSRTMAARHGEPMETAKTLPKTGGHPAFAEKPPERTPQVEWASAA